MKANKNKIELGVNIDHVATIREARKIDYPDPVAAATLAIKGGADSIVCHLREDRRHIKDDDLYRIRRAVSKKVNLEMAVSEEIISIALDVKPDQVTFVPEKREELTTEGGLDVISNIARVSKATERMAKAGIKTSFFIEPVVDQARAAKDAGADMVEFHTGLYANAKDKASIEKEIKALKDSSRFALSIGLKVFAGHGLNYGNTKPLIAINEIEEYNIGHSIVARSVFVGMEQAVKEMKDLLR